MTKRTNRRGVITVPIIENPLITPNLTPTSSAYPSTYPSEDDGPDRHAVKSKQKPFPFLSLPSELRNKIYSMVFADTPAILDLEPSLFRLFNRLQIFALFRVSRQVYEEARHRFFSTHTIRIFPTYPGKYFKTKRPLLARLPAKYRSSITSLDLRLGPGWSKPPQGWVVNDRLGLADCRSVRTLKVFVECDPSDPVFDGYRKYEGFYEKFSADLLEGILREIPSIKVVEFDAYSSVKRTGPMMAGLGEVVVRFDKLVAWGPERRWDLKRPGLVGCSVAQS